MPIEGKSPGLGTGGTHAHAQVSATDLRGDFEQITSWSPPQVPCLSQGSTVTQDIHHWDKMECQRTLYICMYWTKVKHQDEAPEGSMYTPWDVSDTLRPCCKHTTQQFLRKSLSCSSSNQSPSCKNTALSTEAIPRVFGGPPARQVQPAGP